MRDAWAYATANVGFATPIERSTDGYATANVGFAIDPGRAGYGYATLNAEVGLGFTVYPYREHPDYPAAPRY